MKTPKNETEAWEMLIGKIDRFINQEIDGWYEEGCCLCAYSNFRYLKNKENSRDPCSFCPLVKRFGFRGCFNFIPTNEIKFFGDCSERLFRQSEHDASDFIAWLKSAKKDFQGVLRKLKAKKRGKK